MVDNRRTINAQHYSEELAEIITAAMGQKEMSIKDLSRELDVVYEHGRRIVKGFPPSKHILRVLCKVLDLDFNKVEAMVVRARIRRKFGDVSLTMDGKNPELEPIERAWDDLIEDQKQDVISLIKGMAKRNKARRES